MRIDYNTYMKSPEWREFRLRFLRSRFPKCCYVCSTDYKRGFHLHHLTYERFGNESLEDVVMCCRPCHELIHLTYKSQRHQSIAEVTHHLRESFIIEIVKIKAEALLKKKKNKARKAKYKRMSKLTKANKCK